MELGIFLVAAAIVLAGMANQLSILRRLEAVYPQAWKALGKPGLKNNTMRNGLRTAVAMLRLEVPFSTDRVLRWRTIVQFAVVALLATIGALSTLVLD